MMTLRLVVPMLSCAPVLFRPIAIVAWRGIWDGRFHHFEFHSNTPRFIDINDEDDDNGDSDDIFTGIFP